ncbi:MAG: ribonuclease P protein component [Rubrivivax sp.]|nr:ribonuclease P protein component [Rubrivivax sp.]
MQLHTLKKSAEFKRVRGGQRAATNAFVIEGNLRPHDLHTDRTTARFGFVVTKKLGNAVVRNKARRRLKAVVRSLDAGALVPGYDYVVIARSEAVSVPFATLAADFRRALEKIQRQAERVHEGEAGEAVRGASRSNRSMKTGTDAPERVQAAALDRSSSR